MSYRYCGYNSSSGSTDELVRYRKRFPPIFRAYTVDRKYFPRPLRSVFFSEVSLRRAENEYNGSQQDGKDSSAISFMKSQQRCLLVICRRKNIYTNAVFLGIVPNFSFVGPFFMQHSSSLPFLFSQLYSVLYELLQCEAEKPVFKFRLTVSLAMTPIILPGIGRPFHVSGATFLE